MSRIRAALEQRSWSQTVAGLDIGAGSPAPIGDWAPGMAFYRGAGGSPTDQALRLSAVYACLRIISEAISTLPFDTYIRQGGNRRLFRPRPAFMDFNGSSRIDYLNQIVMSLLTDGNAYVYLFRDDMGMIWGALVLDPTLVAVSVVDGRLEYRVNGRPDPLDKTEIMHIKGMCLPGQIVGMSPISYARESIGLGLATQRFGAAFFENGALPGAVVQAPGKFGREAAELFAATWNDRHQGIGNAHRVGVLTEGATLAKVSVSPEDAQFLQTRAFSVPDVARIYGVPPHLIADAEKSTSWGSGLAEQNMSFGQYTLRGWCERIEEAHTSLMPGLGFPDVFTKLNLDALLRAALKERYDSYAVGIASQFMTINEARRLEDLPPVAWGDKPPVGMPGASPSLNPESPGKSTFGGGA